MIDIDEIEIPSIAHDGSISADWLAMTLAEDARIENGRLANAEYLAVKIASVSDFILARAVKAEAEIDRLRSALATAQGWFQDYADGHMRKGDTVKAKRNQDRADFCAHNSLNERDRS